MKPINPALIHAVKNGIKITDYALIQAIGINGPLTVEEAAQCMGVADNTIRLACNRLTDRKLIIADRPVTRGGGTKNAARYSIKKP